MKGRESGMPAEEYWGTFFEPETMLLEMGCRGPIDVLEFGCGYGHFTIAAAKLIEGTVFTNDIERDMVHRTIERTKLLGLTNVEAEVLDFAKDGTGRPDQSVDFVMLFNILHIEHPELLLMEAYRALRPNGRLGLVHWNWDPKTPRGPSLEIRPKPEQCREWAEKKGFVWQPFDGFSSCKWHWGMILHKPIGPIGVV